jgi:peptide/nickel transport system substrate-binding protein
MKRHSLPLLILLMVSSAIPTALLLTASPIVAQKDMYILRTTTYNYQPPPAGSVNIFSPTCVIGSGIYTRGFVIEQLAKYWYLNNTYHPWLAIGWEETTEGLLVYLRRGVTWNDGTPFTARDVVGTFLCLWLSKHPIWQYIDDIVALGDYVVLFKTKYPGNPVMKYYALTNFIAPYHQFKEFIEKANIARTTGNDTLRAIALKELQEFKPEKMIGTGAYEIEVITRDEVILTKRDDYWGLKLGFTKGVYFDKIRLANHPPDAQIAEMENSDQIDIEYHGGAVKGQVYTAPKYVNCTFAAYPSTGGTGTFFNLHKYPFTLKEFRQAIAYAVNISKAMTAVYDVITPIHENKFTGFTPATMMIYLTKETWDSLRSYNYDPKKAEEILLSMGFKRGPDGIWVSPNGTRCEFEMIIHAGWGSGRVNTYLAQQLTEFGIKVNVKAIDPGTINNFIYNSQFDIASAYPYGLMPYFEAAWWTLNWLPSMVNGPSVGFPTVYEMNGKLYNVTELTIKMNIVDEATRKEIINVLARIFNEYLPALPHYVRPGGPLYINFNHIEWPKPWKPEAEGKYRLPCPIIEGQDCAEWTYPFDQSIVWVVIKGLAKPKGLTIEEKPPVYTYVVVYATTDIPGFIGVDGRSYGPYKKGEAISIPREDAERLVEEDKATYTPPLPPELAEVLSRIINDISSLRQNTIASLEGLSSNIRALSDNLSQISSQLANMTMVTVVEAIVILVLVIGLVVTLRKRAEEET